MDASLPTAPADVGLTSGLITTYVLDDISPETSYTQDKGLDHDAFGQETVG